MRSGSRKREFRQPLSGCINLNRAGFVQGAKTVVDMMARVFDVVMGIHNVSVHARHELLGNRITVSAIDIDATIHLV